MFLKYISMYQIALSECKVQHTKKSKLNCVAGASYTFVHWINKVSSSPECVTEALAVLIAVKITQT